MDKEQLKQIVRKVRASYLKNGTKDSVETKDWALEDVRNVTKHLTDAKVPFTFKDGYITFSDLYDRNIKPVFNKLEIPIKLVEKPSYLRD